MAKTEKRTVQLLVRRGALRRYDQLKKSAGHLPVAIDWDRRVEDRRQNGAAAPRERRVNDRRKQPPFTWETADFVVVESATPTRKRKPSKPPSR